MNRTDKMAEYLRTSLGLPSDRAEQYATQILHLADDRQLLTSADFGRRIGRSPNTIITWRSRGQQDVPEPVAQTGQGPLWDGDDVKAWADAHPEQIRLA